MRDAIIKSSIDGLLKNGLRFSIDEVAKSLRISKKTIYKYFASKEELAAEIYGTFYADARKIISDIGDSRTREAAKRILTLYYRSHCMIRSEIFNKYALNTNIRALAEANHEYVKKQFENFLPKNDRISLAIIVDGALQKLCENESEEENIIERLAFLIC